MLQVEVSERGFRWAESLEEKRVEVAQMRSEWTVKRRVVEGVVKRMILGPVLEVRLVVGDRGLIKGEGRWYMVGRGDSMALQELEVDAVVD